MPARLGFAPSHHAPPRSKRSLVPHPAMKFLSERATWDEPCATGGITLRDDAYGCGAAVEAPCRRPAGAASSADLACRPPRNSSMLKMAMRTE